MPQLRVFVCFSVKIRDFMCFFVCFSRTAYLTQLRVFVVFLLCFSVRIRDVSLLVSNRVLNAIACFRVFFGENQ